MDERFDVVVIGGGPAGEAVVKRLAGEGLSIAVVEREFVGGECAYWACVPSKTLLRAPELRAEAAQVRGLDEPREEWGEVAAYRDAVISNLEDTEKSRKLESAGATIVRGAGEIVGPGRVTVGGRLIGAEHLVVASGTTAAIPPVAGIDDVDVWTTREVYTMATPPRSAIVLGGGPVGIETAQMLHGHGVRTTIVEEADVLLAREHQSVGTWLATHLADQGVDVRLGVQATAVGSAGDGIVLSLDDGSEVRAQRLIAAAGREPRTAGLGLETIGLSTGDGGEIEVDEHCRAGDGVWGVGDVTGVMPFTHVAHYQGEIAADDILGRTRSADYRAIPRVVFSTPEVAAVGLTPQQAEERGLITTQGSVDIGTLARTPTYGDGVSGFMTVLADRDAGVLVGAWAVAPLASEWIAATVIAIKARIPIAVLRDTPMQFPTFAEALSSALEEI